MSGWAISQTAFSAIYRLWISSGRPGQIGRESAGIGSIWVASSGLGLSSSWVAHSGSGLRLNRTRELGIGGLAGSATGWMAGSGIGCAVDSGLGWIVDSRTDWIVDLRINWSPESRIDWSASLSLDWPAESKKAWIVALGMNWLAELECPESECSKSECSKSECSKSEGIWVADSALRTSLAWRILTGHSRLALVWPISRHRPHLRSWGSDPSHPEGILLVLWVLLEVDGR
jgi:hypothetical protein